MPITGDLFLAGWGHGNPRNTRHFTLIVNGSIIKEGYTVECATEGFCKRAEVLEDGRLVVEAARSGKGKILITYKGVTADYRHIEF